MFKTTANGTNIRNLIFAVLWLKMTIENIAPMLPNKKASIKSVFSLILRRDFFAWYLSKPYTQNTAKFHIKSIR